MAAAFAELDYRVPVGETFAARIAAAQLGDTALARLRGPALVARRTAEHAARDGEPKTAMIWQLAGTSIARQGSREAVFGRGQVLFVDLATPYEVTCTTPFSQIVANVPTGALGGGHSDLDAVTLRPLAADRLVAPWTAYLRALAAEVAHLDPAGTRAHRATLLHVLDALVTAARPPRDGRRSTGAVDPQRVVETIDARCDDPAFSADRLAEELHLSRRTLFRVLEGEGANFRGLLLRARLRRAVELLRRGWPPTIDQVAAAAGFSSTSHFHAVFQKHVGCTPARFRAGYADPGRG